MLHKFIKAQGGIVHYYTNNIENRTTLFFCHGLTADHTIFEKQYEFFKDRYNLILLDIPMHGLSYPYKNFSYKDCADIMHNILIKENIGEVILIGMSMGGYPCQFFAHYYPDYILGFVAIDTTPLGLKYYSKSDVFWLKQVKPMARLFSDKMLKEQMVRSVSETDYSYNTMMKIYDKADKKKIIEQMDIAYGYFIKENMDVDFFYPILIILGENDKTGKVSRYCKEWAKDIHAPLNIISSARHFSNGDNPEAVNRKIDEFVITLTN